ncbi:hypothetical protein [Streptomyces sp. NRRL F-5123]|uniref:hypothetical protein n=1 Tax=Streptomyces sp. NRRL F-5123 TaxID=1463856 RepID=UPI00131AAB2E|nr:hypothetical protein [Streptomyces sp. NRRL F-5123]
MTDTADESAFDGTDAPVTRREVVRLAEQHGFGAAHGSVALGGGDAGCAAVALAVALLPPGIGLLAGPFGPVAASVGATLIMAGLAVPVLAFGYERRRDARIPRLHLFDGGLVIGYPPSRSSGPTRPEGFAVLPWSDVRVVERVHTSTIGQGGSVQRVWRLELHVRGGPLLCSLGDTHLGLRALRLALAGGADTADA